MVGLADADVERHALRRCAGRGEYVERDTGRSDGKVAEGVGERAGSGDSRSRFVDGDGGVAFGPRRGSSLGRPSTRRPGCLDRILVQAYVPKPQAVSQVCTYLRWPRGFKIPSSAAFGKIGAKYVDEIPAFAEENGIPDFAKGQVKENVAAPLAEWMFTAHRRHPVRRPHRRRVHRPHSWPDAVP